MCTVSFIPKNDTYFITSNRDENIARPPSFQPKEEWINGCKIVYPKDPKAGGTWFAANEKGAIAVLLNGAFERHIPKGGYAMSRGLILLHIISSKKPTAALKRIDLENIEPFTLILFENKALYELRWDGIMKHLQELDTNESYIWSSATLYDRESRERREDLFRSFLKKNIAIEADRIVDFHRNNHDDYENGFIIDRKDGLKTFSITQAVLSNDALTLDHLDLFKDRKYNVMVTEQNPINFIDSLKLKLHKILHWEYWPMEFIYYPIFPVWLFFAIRAKSFFFFNAANPSIKNGGMAMESKKEIYDMIPDRYIPKTVLATKNLGKEGLLRQLSRADIHFPLIAKPDIGMKAFGVDKIKDENELQAYIDRSSNDFLIQELIEYTNELGVFYVRHPNEEKGRITGMVSKEFLSVTGDGKTSILQLIKSNPRSHFQLPSLLKKFGNRLNTVLEAGENFILVPYGSHTRGAKFLDVSHKCNQSLLDTIDDICRQIPDFYYGRLDILYASLEELSEGKNFSIIEINGAGSEATHIYDPKHSLFFAWKEIIRHWRLLYRISKVNNRNGHGYLSFNDGIAMLRANSELEEQLKLI